MQEFRYVGTQMSHRPSPHKGIRTISVQALLNSEQRSPFLSDVWR